MVADLDYIDEESKKRIIGTWQNMSELDKSHFINQVALALSIWGSDQRGKRLVVELLKIMTDDGTNTLADFGLYIDKLLEMEDSKGIDDRVRRASRIIEGYRIKNALSSEPHRELF